MARPAPAGTQPWYSETQIAQTATLVVREILDIRLGAPWPDSLPGQIEWQASQASNSETSEAGVVSGQTYWVYQRPGRWLQGLGSRMDFAYLIGNGDRPSLERVRLSFPGIPGGGPAYWDRLRVAIVDSLARRTGPLQRRDGDTLVLSTGTTIAWDGDREVDCYSARLIADMASPSWNADAWAEGDTIPDGLPDVLRELKARHPSLAAVLANPHLRAGDISNVADALELVRGPSATSEERHLVRYGVHLWGSRFAKLLADPDTALVRAFNNALTPYGAEIVNWPDVGWCYTGGLTDSMIESPDANPWSGYAFLQRMDAGWIDPCGACGYGTKWVGDYFRPTIEHGEAFLRSHPHSPITREVSLILGKAHETAWSLSKDQSPYEGSVDFDWKRYAADAPMHRKAAIERYETQLRTRPGDPRNPRIRRRLARLKLDVDTDYHPYWCIWD